MTKTKRTPNAPMVQNDLDFPGIERVSDEGLSDRPYCDILSCSWSRIAKSGITLEAYGLYPLEQQGVRDYLELVAAEF